MVPIDIILLIFILILTIRAALRGFTEESLSVAAVVLGAWVALILYRNGATFVRTKMNTDIKIFPELISFIVLFFIVFGVVKLVQIMLKDIVKRIHIGAVDHFLGAAFGLLEGITVAACVVVLLRMQPIFDAEPIFAGSIFGNMFAGLSIASILPVIPIQ
ncbi:hypothetical protein FACS1894164_13110 [Spirochaetia bacterium]|nr:hypothetical protein FACS1894164_13110 [Spirochaetia bacterium]